MEVQSKQCRRLEGADDGSDSDNGELNGWTKAGDGDRVPQGSLHPCRIRAPQPTARNQPQ